MAHIIVTGNEKGGTGKSTTAMHLATALARQGFRVGALDLDLRQRSFGRYVENRLAYVSAQGVTLPVPRYMPLPVIDPATLGTGERVEDRQLAAALDVLTPESDFIVIDCPGSHTALSSMAHALADTLVTPLNDSFVDFDLLARIDPASGAVLGPSIYAEMVWQARQGRARAGMKPIDWVVLRNRLGTQAMHNKRRVGAAMDDLARRIGFRVVPGLGERVIYRELFPSGLTLMDMSDIGNAPMAMSHVAARQELRALLAALNLPGVGASGRDASGRDAKQAAGRSKPVPHRLNA